ncbi:hypothetical protein E2C01_080726 [Portunus trituberculatus]|uniref:Uncharacterized protein n=1 Tax=Portunus trituberculatus TaxID=210409 RepID=A0A5B7IKD5_PORTR|nr:hypothetical protein [Portunus trituberculatus]
MSARSLLPRPLAPPATASGLLFVTKKSREVSRGWVRERQNDDKLYNTNTNTATKHNYKQVFSATTNI